MDGVDSLNQANETLLTRDRAGATHAAMAMAVITRSTLKGAKMSHHDVVGEAAGAMFARRFWRCLLSGQCTATR
jgi:hypothetical protein